MDSFEFIEKVPEGAYEENQRVTGYVYQETPLGYKVCFDDKYSGILYADEVFEELIENQKVEVFIKKIRPDMRVDLSLQKIGFVEAAKDAREKILQALRKNKGVLELSDKSSPELIYKKLGISKKKFKATIGTLYKDRIILIHEDRIELIKR